MKTQTEYIKKIKKMTNPITKQLSGLDFVCFPNVYAGGPDTELVIENMQINREYSVLDLCTGNGAIALAASKMGAKEVIGTDINPEAIKNANVNKQKLSIKNVKFIEGNLFDGIKKKFDVITINPPYTDKKAADLTEICFWDENNFVVREFFKELRKYLKAEGEAYFAWADFADQKLLKDLAKKYEWKIKLLSSRTGRTGHRFDVYLIRSM